MRNSRLAIRSGLATALVALAGVVGVPRTARAESVPSAESVSPGARAASRRSAGVRRPRQRDCRRRLAPRSQLADRSRRGDRRAERVQLGRPGGHRPRRPLRREASWPAGGRHARIHRHQGRVGQREPASRTRPMPAWWVTSNQPVAARSRDKSASRPCSEKRRSSAATRGPADLQLRCSAGAARRAGSLPNRWALVAQAGLRTADHILEVKVLPTIAVGVRVRL